MFVVARIGCVGLETYGFFVEATADDFIEPGEGSADDKEDIAGVDLLPFDLPRLLHLHDGFHLRCNIVRGFEVDIGFFHQFEQVALDP